MIDKKHRYTDQGNAELFSEKYGETVKYNHATRKWIIWDGTRWADDASQKVVTLAAEAIKSLFTEAQSCTDIDESRKISSWASTSLNAYRIRSMLTLAQPLMTIYPDVFDTDKWKINVKNGTIDLRTGELLAHNKDHLITKISPVVYAKGASSDLWLGFLNKIFDGDVELIKYMQKVIGYSLTGSTREQCMFIMFGSGANGKSTFIKAILHLLGDYGSQTPTETLVIKQNGGIGNDVARLHGKRFVSASEAEKNHSLAESFIKQITGEDVISARFMYQEYFDFTPEFKVFMTTNHKPKIVGVDHGIWRRLKLIPFSVTIADKDKDAELQKKLIDESSSILNWAIEGVLLWQKEGLQNPSKVNDALKEYKSENDIISEFMGLTCISSHGASIRKSTLHASYTEYCSTNGIRSMSVIAFGKALKERSYREHVKADGSYWLDIEIKPADSVSQ